MLIKVTQTHASDNRFTVEDVIRHRGLELSESRGVPYDVKILMDDYDIPETTYLAYADPELGLIGSARINTVGHMPPCIQHLLPDDYDPQAQVLMDACFYIPMDDPFFHQPDAVIEQRFNQLHDHFNDSLIAYVESLAIQNNTRQHYCLLDEESLYSFRKNREDMILPYTDVPRLEGCILEFVGKIDMSYLSPVGGDQMRVLN